MMQKRRVCSKVLGAILTSLMLLAMVPSVAFADGFSVTYDVNRPDSYSLYATNTPVDESSPYASGATVTVLSDIYANGIHAFDWAGHEFTGWNTSADGTGTSYAVGSTFAIAQDTVLYAQWEALCTIPSPDIYKAIVLGDDPDLSGRTFTFTLTADPSNPTDGVQGLSTTATITGAELESGGGYDASTGTFHSYTLADAFGTASFSKPGTYVYTVTETADAGTGYTYDTSTYTWMIDIMAIEAGERANPRVELLVNKTRLLDSTGAAVSAASFANDYPKANTYTIHFDANATDATGTMADVAMTCGTAADLPVNAFVRDGYTFAGWNTSADGIGTSYADAASVEDLTTTDGATVILYAQWKANSASSSVVDNGGVTTTTSSASIPQTGDRVSLTAFIAAMLFVIGTSIVGISLRVRRRTHYS